MRDILGYEGRTCVVVGAASGMGDACARTLVDLGAEVHALDIQPIPSKVAAGYEIDLKSEDSIREAVEKLPGEVHSLFHCAGVPGAPVFTALDTMLVNFIGPRLMNDLLLPRMKAGASIAQITSVAGIGYRKNLEKLKELTATGSFEDARAWCEANPDVANGYLGSKQAIIVYTYEKASELAKQEIRINCLSPAPTDTPMIPDFHKAAPKEFMDEHFQAPVGRYATPEEMGEPLVLLNSDASRFISGHNLIVDYGYCGEVEVGLRPALL